ncbi:hypothetical protein V1525DRAFT_415687 [Lipomyces kononenkoae]|uniref:Uncharacterized protein n=1 Tax=Lipomyces kononenkoae TaxID=34357 RepID=A0ACC3SPW7_LIPKO
MPQMAQNIYNQPTLKSPSDWAAWYDNIKTSAQLTLIWEYCDPDVDESNIKKLEFPSERENDTGYAKYKVQIDIWSNRSQSLANVMVLIRSTVGKDYQPYLLGASSVHKMLVSLKRAVKPNDNILKRDIQEDLDRRDQGPKRLGLEPWLTLHRTIMHKGKQVDMPQAKEEKLIELLVSDCEEINPVLYYEYWPRLMRGESLGKTLEQIIGEFKMYENPRSRKDKTHAAFATLSGQRTSAAGQKCPCGSSRHKRTQCYYVNPSLRPEGWVGTSHPDSRAGAGLPPERGTDASERTGSSSDGATGERPDTSQTTRAVDRASTTPCRLHGF